MIALSVITSNQPPTLTKGIRLDANGQLKKSTVANTSAGVIQTGQVASASAFAELLQTLKHNQALVFGVPKDCDPYSEPQQRQLLSRAKYEQQNNPANAITRTKDCLTWPPGAGVLLLDYDPQDGEPALSKTALIERLTEVVPELASCAYVWWCSSSSLIFNTETQEQLAGIKGQRVYIMVQDASDIERAGKVLFNRLWLAGYGHYKVSRAGAALERSLVDANVWQTNRLDFAAGAHCVAPLEQRRGAPQVNEGGFLDTALALPDLTDSENADLKAAKDKARELVQGEIELARHLYIEETADELVMRKHGDRLKGKELDAARKQAREIVSRACERLVLAGDFGIRLASGKDVTVGEILDNPSEYHGKQTLDPLEPEYDGHKVCGKLYLIGGRPNLYSQAHGGRNFRLIRQPRRIEHQKGLTYEATQQTLSYLRELPDVFDFGSELVQVKASKANRLSRDSLAFYLGGVAQYWCWKRTPAGVKYEALMDPHPSMLNQLLAIGARRKLKPLKAVINAPVMDMSGRVLTRAGYDSTTQLFLDVTSDPPTIPEKVNEHKALAALERLMHPFRGFELASKLDRGVLLAGILTAIQRPVLDTAPAFAADAPVFGSGKTLMCECLAMLGTGDTPKINTFKSGRYGEEENAKKLIAALVDGARCIVLDNVIGTLGSATYAAFLTAGVYTDRILGKSEMATFPNRALLLISGNNMTIAADMSRRVLVCRIDTGQANPTTRKFDFNPVQEIKENRQQLVQAGLTLIRGYQQSQACAAGGAVPDESTASYDQWDAMARQPAAWIAQLLPKQFQDPADMLKQAAEYDPDRQELADILEGISVIMGEGEWFETRELYKELSVGYNPLAGRRKNEARQELVDTLEGILGGKLTKQKLGTLLSFRVGRIADGRQLAKSGGTKRAIFCVKTG